MEKDQKTRLQSFLYNVSTENYANANKDLQSLLKHKVDQRFNEALEKVKKQNSLQ